MRSRADLWEFLRHLLTCGRLRFPLDVLHPSNATATGGALGRRGGDGGENGGRARADAAAADGTPASGGGASTGGGGAKEGEEAAGEDAPQKRQKLWRKTGEEEEGKPDGENAEAAAELAVSLGDAFTDLLLRTLTTLGNVANENPRACEAAAAKGSGGSIRH